MRNHVLRRALCRRDGGTEVDDNRHSGKEREFRPTRLAGAFLIGRTRQGRSDGAEVNSIGRCVHPAAWPSRLLPLPNPCASRCLRHQCFFWHRLIRNPMRVINAAQRTRKWLHTPRSRPLMRGTMYNARRSDITCASPHCKSPWCIETGKLLLLCQSEWHATCPQRRKALADTGSTEESNFV